MEVDLVAQEGERGGVEGSEIEDDREMGDITCDAIGKGSIAGSEDTSMGEDDVETSEEEEDTPVSKAVSARKAPRR